MKILFTAIGVPGEGAIPTLASFQEADLRLLRELGHEVRVVVWRGPEVFSILRGARWADLVYCWSMSYHSYVASFVAKKLICAVGGYEFARIPECNYGNLVKRRMRLVTYRVWSAADGLLYVNPSLAEEATRAFGHPGNAHYLPTGYDSTFWTPGNGPRSDMALTVCHAPTLAR